MKDKKSILIIVIALVTILAGTLTAIFFFNRIKQNPPGTVGNTAGNLNNRGLFCENDGTVYFANAYDGGALYSMNPDETNLKRLSTSSAEYINAGGKYLYFFQVNSGSSTGLGSVRSISGIYRCNTKGDSAKCLTRDPAMIINLVDNQLFYQRYNKKEGTNLYCQGIDGKDVKMAFPTAINPACAINGTIYFNGNDSNHYLFSMDAATQAVSTIWEYDIWNPVIQGDLVYFMDVHNNYRLCCYSLSSGEMKVLTEDRIDCYNVAGTLIYYQKNDADAPALKRLTTDGSGNVLTEETVADGVYENINVTSANVYFQQFQTPVPIYKTSTGGAVNVTTFDAAASAVMTESK